jgi:hypothetical protein
MRVPLAAALLVLTLASARAESVPGVSDADRHEIQRVITAQIDAFRHDDGAGAFRLASPNIQSIFGDKEHFMAMVRQGYQPVYNPRAVRFDDLVTMDGRIVQRVALVGPDGLAALALYAMEHEPDGSWRIDGCELTKSDDVNT